MKLLRILGYTIAIITVAAVIGLCIALWAYRDIPANHLETKYANRASRFINIDGARIHYRDEGEGPAVLLLHANFGNLIGWDPWVDALKDSYRVVRMDFTSHGLTGPDPTGDYGADTRAYRKIYQRNGSGQVFDRRHIDGRHDGDSFHTQIPGANR